MSLIGVSIVARVLLRGVIGCWLLVAGYLLLVTGHCLLRELLK